MPLSQINSASIENGAVTPSDLSTGAPSWDAAGIFAFNSGYGSAATAYGVRAWVNFNGTGTVAIRASGNVSSITDNGVGDYTVNFTNAMPDANYGFSLSGNLSSTFAQFLNAPKTTLPTTLTLRIQAQNSVGAVTDQDYVCVAIFR